jgi:hypothetical protein
MFHMDKQPVEPRIRLLVLAIKENFHNNDIPASKDIIARILRI